MGISGHMGDAHHPLDQDATKRFVIPDAFLHSLVPSMGEGSTLAISTRRLMTGRANYFSVHADLMAGITGTRCREQLSGRG